MPKNDDSTWEYYGSPVRVVAMHQLSRAALLGKASCWDKRTNTVYVSFDLTEEHRFSVVTGMGRDVACKHWRLSHASIVALTGDPAWVIKEPVARRRGGARKPKAEDPRQTKIEGT